MKQTSKKKSGNKIAYSELINSMYPLILAICDSPMGDLDVMIEYSELRSDVESKITNYNELRKKIVEQNCVKEDGKPVITGNKYSYAKDEDLDLTNKLLIELQQKTVEVKFPNIDKDFLKTINGITPNMVYFLKKHKYI